MKRFLAIGMVLLLAVYVVTLWAVQLTPATTLQRITDSIGRQYACVSSSHQNTYGFGGVADTLATDSTVSRGTLMNIRRLLSVSYEPLGDLLQNFIASRTALDSAQIYSKWSSVCWALNNHYSSVGGISGKIMASIDSGRLSPRFAAVARANGVYLSPFAVFPDSQNMGYFRWDGGNGTYYDSSNIDSTKYGPTNLQLYCVYAAGASSGTCTVKVYGANKNLIHGTLWKFYKPDGVSTGDTLDKTSGADSLYGIDSVKYVTTASGPDSANFLLRIRPDRLDSL